MGVTWRRRPGSRARANGIGVPRRGEHPRPWLMPEDAAITACCDADLRRRFPWIARMAGELMIVGTGLPLLHFYPDGSILGMILPRAL